MKKLFVLFAAFALSLTLIAGAGSVNASADVVSMEDNYAAYVLATGEATGENAGQNGYVAYHTKISDGNAIMTFDLLSITNFGWFGVICGDVNSVADIETLKDYALFGKSTRTTLDLGDLEFKFEEAYTYRFTVNADDKRIKLESKKTTANDAFSVVFDVAATFDKSTTIGIAAISDGLASATAIIDNLLITDLTGFGYVDNSYNGDNSVKLGSMRITTSNVNCNVYKHKDIMYLIRFVDEQGNLFATQNVCLYGSVTAPEAPEKEGYYCIGWSEDLSRVDSELLIYPIYAEGQAPSTESSSSLPEQSTGGDTTSETVSGTSGSESTAQKSCGGSMSVMGSVFGITAMGIAVMLKRRNNK